MQYIKKMAHLKHISNLPWNIYYGESVVLAKYLSESSDNKPLKILPFNWTMKHLKMPYWISKQFKEVNGNLLSNRVFTAHSSSGALFSQQ